MDARCYILLSKFYYVVGPIIKIYGVYLDKEQAEHEKQLQEQRVSAEFRDANDIERRWYNPEYFYIEEHNLITNQ